MIQISTESVCLLFIVPGEIRGQGRPRTAIRRGRNGRPYAQIYEDEKDTVNKHNIQLYAMEAKKRRGIEGIAQPDGRGITVYLTVYLPIPKSMSKKKTEMAMMDRIRPQRKPDLDNVLKAVLDAMNGIIYKDDSEVTEVHVHRLYSESPAITVGVIWKEERMQ